MAAPNTFKRIVAEATAAVKAGNDLAKLRVRYLGRKGELAQAMGVIRDAAPGQRAKLGKQANEAKRKLETLLAENQNGSDAPAAGYDITLPGEVPELGHRHPVSLVIDELVGIFGSMGFELADGPEVEDDWHNFEALNIPPGHPGRDMQDTFYVAGSERPDGTYGLLPRTQTSSVQIRHMETARPPLRIVSAGKVYRNESEDATHSAVFHQLEGLLVDQHASFTDLKGLLEAVVKELLGDDVKLRFRPSYFPFTEPSAEVDVSSPRVRDGQWLELLGCGMVNPRVLENVGVSAKTHQGYAFGIGIERIAMLRYGLDDLRPFLKPDIRLLRQFS
jgi:phenylalanyl-tRNA synthetase alpha chain